MCLPVRDDADEIVGIMLAQLLERAGHWVTAIPIGSVDGMLVEVARMQLDNRMLVGIAALRDLGMPEASIAGRGRSSQTPKSLLDCGSYAEIRSKRPVRSAGVNNT